MSFRTISISVEKDMHKKLKQAAVTKSNSVSSVVRVLLDKYLDLMLGSSEEVQIVLKVPKAVCKDKELLSNWLTQKTNALNKVLLNENS